MNSKAIAYDLGIAVGSITLWLTPFDITRAIGYATSIVFSGRAYITGVSLLAKQQKDDEKQGIIYEAETDFYDQLLGTSIESALEIKALEIENRTLERLIPLANYKRRLEQQIEQIPDTELRYETNNVTLRNDEQIRASFPESMDATSWKAILKALQSGASKEDICRDVLGGSEAIAAQYLELLKEKYLG